MDIKLPIYYFENDTTNVLLFENINTKITPKSLTYKEKSVIFYFLRLFEGYYPLSEAQYEEFKNSIRIYENQNLKGPINILNNKIDFEAELNPYVIDIRKNLTEDEIIILKENYPFSDLFGE